jgi:hypothetical protein
MNNATTKTGDSDTVQAEKAARKIRAMLPSKRSAAFAKLPRHIQNLATVPCVGQAHSPEPGDGGGHIDHCMCCLNYTWGRMLRPE